MSWPVRSDPDEPPCVWVLAGVLSHRPCHRHYACDGCDLYHALRGPGGEAGTTMARNLSETEGGEGGLGGGFREVERLVSSYLVQLAKSCDLHLDRPYSPAFFWIQELSQEEVLLGLDCQILRILYPVKDLILPNPGAWLRRGDPMGWLQRGHLVLPLSSPLSGEVLEVNQTFVAEVREMGFPRSQAWWLIRLHPHESLNAVPGLLRGLAMLGWYQEKLGMVRDSLVKAMDPGVEAGGLLNDGGEINRNLEEVLGASSFRKLLGHLFRSPGRQPDAGSEIST